MMPTARKTVSHTAASADDAIAGYLSDLQEARTILSEAYSFNPDAVAIW